MSKKELVEKQKNELASIDFAADAGAGVGTIAASETVIPYVNLLQQMSPECNEGTDRYMPAAKPGMLLNTATRELFPARTGIVIVPLLKQHFQVEWTPRDKGGGLVARHDPGSDFVKRVREENRRDEKNMLLTPEGNHLLETFYLTALQLETPDSVEGDVVCVSFARTKIGAWREFMQPVYKVATRYPLFAHRLALRTKPQKDKQQRPFHNYDGGFAIPAPSGKWRDSLEASLIKNPDQYAFAREAFQFVNRGLETGEVKLADETAANVPDDDAPAPAAGGKSPF